MVGNERLEDGFLCNSADTAFNFFSLQTVKYEHFISIDVSMKV